MRAPPAPCRDQRIATETGERRWAIAEETPVEIGFNGEAWTVMLATPLDLGDLAIGLAFTEGVLEDAGAVETVRIDVWPEGVTADIRIDPVHLATDRLRRRTLIGRTGCGLCGVETLADLHDRPETALIAGRRIEEEAVARALDALSDHQPLNASTHSVHAAAWCAPDGGIETAREDVGRHNALDKLAGARARAGLIGREGFVVMSSRCSYELVIKAARIGAAGIASVSAPTGLALDIARARGLEILCRGEGGAPVRCLSEDVA